MQNYGDFRKYRGVAYNAKIAFFDIGINYNNPAMNSLKVPTNLDTGLFGVLYSAGARIQSMSWGGWQDKYDSTTIAVDKYMYNNPDVLLIFAAGNNGTKTHTVGTPANCKNCLTIGAHLNDEKSFKHYASSELIDQLTIDSVASFSSKGPTNDNRIKPDILAPGWFITSALANQEVDTTTGDGTYHCDLIYMRGTSMATPAASGAAALVYEYFTSGFYPSGTKNIVDVFVPSGALLKAMLITSGQSMKNVVTSDDSDATKYSSVPISTWSNGKYPNSVEGYGRMQLDTILNFGQSSLSPLTLFVVGAASSSSAHYAEVSSTVTSVSYTVKSSSQKTIRVCLTYTDNVPSSAVPSGTSPLMNKLSIALYATNDLVNPIKNTLIYPDNANNVKMIEFTHPSANTDYVIIVKATTLSSSPQPFSLVIVQDITTAKSSTEFNSVTYSDDLKLGKDNIIAISVLSALAFFLLLSLITIYHQKRKHYEPVQTNIRPVSLVSLSSIPPTRIIVPQERDHELSYEINMVEKYYI